jgi:hypothetical protein
MLRLAFIFQLDVKMFRVTTREGSQNRAILTRFSHTEDFPEAMFVVQFRQLLTAEASKRPRVDPLNFEIGVDYPDACGEGVND